MSFQEDLPVLKKELSEAKKELGVVTEEESQLSGKVKTQFCYDCIFTNI